MPEKWYSDDKCRVCGKPALEKEHLCQPCFDKLQTHYAEICLNCKNYTFIEWTEQHVQVLAKKLEAMCGEPIPFDMLFNTARIIILPFKVCPKCNIGEEGNHGW